LNGTLQVDPELAPHLRHGIFTQPGASFKASLRMAHSGFEPDNEPKGASIAVKLTGVSGQPIDLNEYPKELREINAGTQDFIFIAGTDNFNVAVRPDDMALMHKRMLKWGMIPAVMFTLLRHPISFFRILGVISSGQALTNPFLTQQNTIHAARFGGPDTAAKFILKPCTEKPMPAAPEGKKDFIHEVIAEHVASEGVCMDVLVQRQVDPCTDSIENLRNSWTGPMEHVGKLTVPKGGGSDTKSCEFTTYSPWYGLEEHKPLGWVARTRRVVYEAAARMRLKKSAACPFFK
jgi:hypothetical protein